MLKFTGLFYCLIIIVILPESIAKNYCGPDTCNNSKQHTLCKFQSEDPARHCVEYEKTIKTVKEKKAILDKLNSRRNKIAGGELRSLPSAENMMKLEWNEELELSAQRWANQCVKHSAPDIKDACRDLGSVSVGQNIATIYGEAPGLTPLALVDVWYMELLNINASVVPNYQSSSDAGYSHYEYFTQLVWANSRQVGCGGVKFKERLQDLGIEKRRAIYRLVCNFVPGGNILNQSVYDEGSPCSKCAEGTCDPVYPALCSSKPLTTSNLNTVENEPTAASNIIPSRFPIVDKKSSHNTIKTLTLEVPYTVPTLSPEDEDYKPFDYYPHLHEYVRPPLVTSTKMTTSCKDIMVVDEFLELLKKKLSTDPLFKDFLLTSTMSSGNLDSAYTDAIDLVSKIYSKKMLSTTPKMPERDYLNSTLLVDLVEAVIFRSGDKMKVTQEGVRGTQSEPDVSPVKIQAELGEIKRNSDFNGHLFFPEEMETDDNNTELTELYYDVTISAMPEINIDAMRRNKATKDFLDEILESETITDNSDKNAVVHKREVTKLKNGNIIKYKSDSLPSDYYEEIVKDNMLGDNIVPPENFKRDLCDDSGTYTIQYKELLRKLALDLKPLKLNERFHCTQNNSQICFSTALYIYVIILKYMYYN